MACTLINPRFFDDKTRNIHSSASSKQKSPSRSGGLRAKSSQEREGEGGRLQDEGANWVSRWVDSQLLFLRSFSRAECRLSILSYGEKEDRETKWTPEFVSEYSESCACRAAMRSEPVRSSQLSNAVCLVHAACFYTCELRWRRHRVGAAAVANRRAGWMLSAELRLVVLSVAHHSWCQTLLLLNCFLNAKQNNKKNININFSDIWRIWPVAY